MAKPDGRIEKGQRLGTAISARAWNRAQDAADIVLGVRPGVEAGPLSTLRLPCVRATLREKGFFGEVRYFEEEPGFEIAQQYPTTTMPATINSLAAETDLVKGILTYAFPSTTRSGLQTYNNVNAGRRFAICISNDDNEYAMSGLAFTRIRVLNSQQRYARLPSPVTGYSGEAPDGCLDSAWWGPARIIGYVAENSNSELFLTMYGLQLTNTVYFRWALVHF